MKNILLVDDTVDILEIHKDIIEEYLGEKVKVITAKDGQQALDVFDDDIDLVISDIEMPIMNGNELIKAIRRMGSKVSIIACTGNPSAIEVTLDVDSIIFKPTDIGQFVLEIEEILNI